MAGYWRASALVLSLVWLSGCSKSGDTPAVTNPSTTSADGHTPAQAIFRFLTAVRDDRMDLAGAMLTPIAKEKLEKAGVGMTQLFSPTAKFEVGDVEMVEGGAHVATTVTDVDPEGKERSDRTLWMLRNEPQGWRVAGMAIKVFEDELPVILNFEDPEDMIRKQQLVEEEFIRREEQKNSPVKESPNLQAKENPKSGEPATR